MAKLPRIKKPFTPIMRRFLHDVFKPSAAVLGKRARSSSPSSPSISPSPSPPNCVALQNEDTSQDAIIITAFSNLPFCCHADLLTMSRPQLLSVASALNAKLPSALQIDVSPIRTDAFIRNAIETLVGIRRTAPVPPAPKPVRSMSLSRAAFCDDNYGYDGQPSMNARRTIAMLPPSPASPLAARSKSGVNSPLPLTLALGGVGVPRQLQLYALREEEEGFGSRERLDFEREYELERAYQFDLDLDLGRAGEGGQRKRRRVLREALDEYDCSASPTPAPNSFLSRGASVRTAAGFCQSECTDVDSYAEARDRTSIEREVLRSQSQKPPKRKAGRSQLTVRRGSEVGSGVRGDLQPGQPERPGHRTEHRQSRPRPKRSSTMPVLVSAHEMMITSTPKKRPRERQVMADIDRASSGDEGPVARAHRVIAGLPRAKSARDGTAAKAEKPVDDVDADTAKITLGINGLSVADVTSASSVSDMEISLD